MSDDSLNQLIKTLRIFLGGHRGDLIIETAKKILSINPQSYEGYFGLILGYMKTQQYELMLETCLRAISYWPHIAWFRYMHYIYYFSTGKDWYKAKLAIEEAIKLDPVNARYYRHLGEVYLVNREHAKAVVYLRKAVELNPDSAEYRSRLALGLLRLHKKEESLKMARQALKDDPADSYVLDTVGLILTLSGELDEAEELFKSALRDIPTYSYFQRHLDIVKREKQDRENRKKRGLRYTPLYLRHKGMKLHFDENKHYVTDTKINQF